MNVILKSLIDIGRKSPWLAQQLGISLTTMYRKLKTDGWDYKELKRMKEIFRWKTLEG